MAALKTKEKKFIKDVHLLGGAVNNFSSDSEDGSTNWHDINTAVSDSIYNYYSSNDDVLKYLYSAGELFQGSPIGRNEILAPGVINKDVTEFIDGHSAYKKEINRFMIS